MTVANATYATPLFSTGAGNQIIYNIQVGAAIGAAPADKNDAGLVSFDSSQFSVDGNGFVQLTAGVTGITTLTGDDSVAVTGDGAGNVDLFGLIVANGTNVKPLYINGDAVAFSQTVELQVSTAIALAPADTNDAGIASFDSAAFTVDANGWVQLVGGGPAMVTLTGDDSVPVSPSGTGNFNLFGVTVANATNSKPLYILDSVTPNSLDFDIQVGAAITGAPADKNDAGLVSFDDTMFTVDANGYVQLIGGSLAIDSIDVDFNTAPGTDPVVPTGAGLLTISGSTVANATNANAPVATHSRAANAFAIEVQVSAAITGAPADKFDAGLCSFDDTMFTVDANGFVQLAGGSIAADSFDVDFNTAPGTDPVVPTGAGLLIVTGSTVANATNLNAPVATHSRAANTYGVEVQVAADITGAPADKFDAGLSSYNDTQFLVDANGYVSLVGGSDLPSVQTLTGDDAVVVGPDASGNIDLTGLTVANATHAKPVYVNSGANAEVVEVQVAADRTGAPADKNDAGLASFDDTVFSVDANGYVTLTTTGIAETITGDSGGALSPVANNWNILGLSGSKTSGSGATLTVKSPPYADSTAATLTVNSGTFATAAGAYTLPAAPADGDLCEIVCITTGIVVTGNTGQEIQLGAAVSSSAGTATNTSKGDVLCLRYRSTDTAWYATSAVGVWTLA